jgi:DNA mismatch repair protein MutH
MRPPHTETALLARAHDLEGVTLAEIAVRHGIAVPADLRRAKGWIGALLETALGAEGGSDATWDFPALRIELKTIPVGPTGRPRESTGVCTVPQGAELQRPWAEAWLRAKLARVLFVPIAGSGPPGDRRVGAARLWSPSPAEEAVLQADWEQLREWLGAGQFDGIDATWGQALQVRPKAADARARQWAMDGDAEWVQVNPRGFYLRASFTAGILASARTTPA